MKAWTGVFLGFTLLLVGCGEPSDTSGYNPAPQDENVLLSDTVPPKELAQALDKIGAWEDSGASDGCSNYRLVAGGAVPGATLENRPDIAKRGPRCLAFYEALGQKMRALGYDQVQARDMQDNAVYTKAYKAKAAERGY